MTALYENELERELSARLHDELAGMQPPPNLAASVRRQHNRRTWGLRLAGAVPVVAAFAIAAALIGSPSTPPPAGPGAPKLLDVAFVSSQTATALGDLSQYVQRSHEARTDGTAVDRRIDGSTRQERSDEFDARGTLTYSVLKPADGEGLVVDHVHRTWYNDKFGTPKVMPGTEKPGMIYGPIYDPAVISDAEASNTLRLIGPESLSGKDVLHLRWDTIAGFTLDLWVDATTYLPVRHTDAGAKGGSTTDYTWLPRTPENLAAMDLKAPAGFTKGAPENPLG